MRVEVHLYTQSQPINIPDAVNAYTKGPMYCVMYSNGAVSKFPIEHIFRVQEFNDVVDWKF